MAFKAGCRTSVHQAMEVLERDLSLLAKNFGEKAVGWLICRVFNGCSVVDEADRYIFDSCIAEVEFDCTDALILKYLTTSLVVHVVRPCFTPNNCPFASDLLKVVLSEVLVEDGLAVLENCIVRTERTLLI